MLIVNFPPARKWLIHRVTGGRGAGTADAKDGCMNNVIRTQDASVKNLVARAYPDYAGRRIAVEAVDPATEINCASYWSDGNRDYFVFLALVDGSAARVEAPAQSAYDRPVAGLDRVTLPKGVVCVRRTFAGSREYVTVLVRSDDLAPGMLPAAEALTDLERKCLVATRSLKNSYAGETDLRRKSTGMDPATWAATQDALRARGLLNKAGAITDAGRNAIDGVR